MSGKLTEREVSLANSDMDYLGKLTFRWSLWLALANAGGLLAFGNRIAEAPDKPIAYLIFPSCWFFAGGLLTVGASVWFATERYEIATEGWMHRDAGLEQRLPPRWVILGDELLGGVSAILFVIGLLYPLSVATIRYVTTGTFTP